MNFEEKIANLMARPNQQPGPTDNQPWYLKYGVRIMGITGAFFCILFGLFNSLSVLLLNVSCLVGGMIQVIVGFLVLVLEAPCCFICIDHIGKVTDAVEAKPLYYKAALYCVMSIIPIFVCFGLGSLFPCALIFGTGVLYGMMALGKKASREDMAAAATSPTQMQPAAEGQMQMSTDQHITLMEDPDVWRPT